MTGPQRKLSIIVPVLNEAGIMDGFIQQFKDLPGNWEIIIGDGGSTDGTIEKLPHWTKVVRCRKGRAHQMNEAALLSTGSVLLFLHCDSQIPMDLYDQVCDVLDRGYSFGCFRIRFDSCHPLLSCCGLFSSLRVLLRKIAFGDQGIFLTRELFFETGGFPLLPLMEDYQLSLNLRKKYPPGLTKGYLTTSARRFQKGGILKTMWHMQVLQHRFRKGVPAEELAKEYRMIR